MCLFTVSDAELYIYITKEEADVIVFSSDAPLMERGTPLPRWWALFSGIPVCS